VRGTCASICDPANDYRAPVCLDGGEAVVAGCLRCDQIVNEALAEGDELGTMVCPGTAAAAWDALSACVVTSCGAVCPGGVMPTNACVQCLDDVDADGGCATEMAGCVAN
jgi:hypothetical protein